MTRIGTHSGPTATARSIPDYSRGIRRSGEGIVRRGPRRHSCARRFRPSRARSAPGRAGARRREGPREVLPAERDARWWGKKKKADPLARWGAGRDSDCGPSSTATAKAKGSAEGIAARPIRGVRAGATLGTDFAPDAADRRYLESTCPALEDAFVALEAARRAWPREREGGGGGEPNPSEPARGSGSGLDDEDARRTPAKTTTPAEIESGDAPPRPETPARARAESLPNAPNTAPNTPNAAPNTPNAAGSFGAGSARRRRVTAVRTAATPTAATPATLSPRREGEGGGGGGDGGSGGRSSASDPRTPGGDGGARSPRGAGRGRRGRRPEPPWVPRWAFFRGVPRAGALVVGSSPAAFLLLLRPRRREVVSRVVDDAAPPPPRVPRAEARDAARGGLRRRGRRRRRARGGDGGVFAASPRRRRRLWRRTSGDFGRT